MSVLSFALRRLADSLEAAEEAEIKASAFYSTDYVRKVAENLREIADQQVAEVRQMLDYLK